MDRISRKEKPGENWPSTEYRWVIVGVLWLVHAIGFLNFSSLGILAPFIQEDLKLTSAQIGLFISAVSIGASLTQMPVGLIADLAGVRLVLTLGVGLMGLLLAVFSFAPSFPVAIVILLVYGLATGMINPTASRSIMDWFPPVGRATAMGAKQTGVNFGGILAGILLPALALTFSWRKSLLMVGIVEAACAALIYRFAKEAPLKPGSDKPSFEWRKIFHTILHRDIRTLGGVAFFFMASQFCFSAYLTLFLTRELHYSVILSGRYFALSYLIGAAARILWSLLSDYLFRGRRKGILVLIAWIMLLASLSMSLIAFFPAASSFLLASVLAFGVSGIGWNAIFITILGETAGKESIGLAIGAGFFFGFMGSLICPPLFGYIVDVTKAYGPAWLFMASLAAANVLLLMRFKEKA